MKCSLTTKKSEVVRGRGKNRYYFGRFSCGKYRAVCHSNLPEKDTSEPNELVALDAHWTDATTHLQELRSRSKYLAGSFRLYQSVTHCAVAHAATAPLDTDEPRGISVPHFWRGCSGAMG